MTATDNPFGYLLVHFIEDPDGYAEKIYMDLSDGDNPRRWIPLNDGKPILTSTIGTTGVRDPHIIRNPQTGTWYVIATDLRVFGGDNAGWFEWTRHASTNLIIWESDDLVHWGDPRMLDVSRKPDGTHLELGMAWACECLWVPDYYPEGHEGGRGAFVMYWSSTIFNDDDPDHTDDGVYCTVLWGTTTDFTQQTYEYGGVFIDTGGDSIDTTMVQRPLPDGGVRTYRITKATLSAMVFGWTLPTLIVGGSRMRSGPACRNMLVPVMCRTAILEAWKGRRCLQTITMMARMRMNGICSWT